MNDSDKRSSPDLQKCIGHETKDVSPTSIGVFALGLVLMIAVVLPLLSWTFWQFEAAARRADPLQNPLAGDQVPPSPRLQVEPTADLNRFRREERQRLSSYGWIDPEKNVVHIPIDEAMKLLAERGLPEPQGSREPLPTPEKAR